MGLDGVELIMQCEEQFCIKISDEAASQVKTVDDLYQLILRQLPRGGSASGAVFYRIRQGLVACGVDRDRVLPTTRLDDLLPRQQRPVLWAQLSSATQLRLPPLVRRSIVVNSIGLLILLSLTLGFALTAVGWAVILAGAAMAILLNLLTRSWRDEFPPNCQTIQDLVYAAIGKNADRFLDNGGLTEREVWRMLQRIIAEQFGFREEDITPELRFKEDLNV